jgi:hypothetical protein
VRKEREAAMNRLQETLPSAEEATLAKLCNQELSAIIKTRAETQIASRHRA